MILTPPSRLGRSRCRWTFFTMVADVSPVVGGGSLRPRRRFEDRRPVWDFHIRLRDAGGVPGPVS